GRKEACGIVGKKIAGEGAFLRLRNALPDRLAHLLRHQPAVGRSAGPQQPRGLAHRDRSFREIQAAPGLPGGVHLFDGFSDLLERRLLVLGDGLAGGGVDRRQRHRLFFLRRQALVAGPRWRRVQATFRTTLPRTCSCSSARWAFAAWRRGNTLPTSTWTRPSSISRPISASWAPSGRAV